MGSHKRDFKGKACYEWYLLIMLQTVKVGTWFWVKVRKDRDGRVAKSAMF